MKMSKKSNLLLEQ